MIRVNEQKFNEALHDLLRMVNMLNNLEGNLTDTDLQALKLIESRLKEIRQDFVESINLKNGGGRKWVKF